jgi:hypothetical protein
MAVVPGSRPTQCPVMAPASRVREVLEHEKMSAYKHCPNPLVGNFPAKTYLPTMGMSVFTKKGRIKIETW